MTIQEYIINKTFPNNQEAVKDLINATGNPELAMQVLLGIQAEDWNRLPTNRVDEKGVTLRSISYDPWGDRVHYEYDRVAIRWGKTPETPRSETNWEKSEIYSVKIEFPEVSTSAMSIESWNKLREFRIPEDTTFG